MNEFVEKKITFSGSLDFMIECHTLTYVCNLI